MRFVLNTARTVKQGNALESKLSPAYEREVSTAQMHPFDMLELGVEAGDHVLLRSDAGSVVVRVEPSEGMERGSVFLPLGPHANQLTPVETHATGMPDFKSVMVEAVPTEEAVPTMKELLKRMGGKSVDLP